MQSEALELEQHPLLQKLSPEHLDRVLECGTDVQFKPGTHLFRAGQEATEIFLIQDGKIAIDLDVPGRVTLTIQTIGAGGVIGWSWLFPPYTWHFDARVLQSTRSISLNAQHLRDLCDQNRDLGYELLREFSSILFDRLMATRFQLINVYDLY